jgi:hypothetical protein
MSGGVAEDGMFASRSSSASMHHRTRTSRSRSRNRNNGGNRVSFTSPNMRIPPMTGPLPPMLSHPRGRSRGGSHSRSGYKRWDPSPSEDGYEDVYSSSYEEDFSSLAHMSPRIGYSRSRHGSRGPEGSGGRRPRFERSHEVSISCSA